jgi:hypothetical protein
VNSLVPWSEVAVAVIFSATDILAAGFLTEITTQENEKWRIAAK